jgi:hypothetical protein
MDGFIKCERTAKTDDLVFSFLNPSVGDFLLNYLRERLMEQKRHSFDTNLKHTKVDVLSRKPWGRNRGDGENLPGRI